MGLVFTLVIAGDKDTTMNKMAVFWVVAPCSLVDFYQATRLHNNPEDSHLRIHRRENLKSYLIMNKYEGPRKKGVQP
jgi:hypothetical protein